MAIERSRLRALGGAAIVLFGGALATDCTSDHSSLAARPRTAGAGGKGAGAGGMAGTAGRPHGGSAGQGGTGATMSPPDKHVETPGRSVFTVMHGVVDAERLVWCFARVRDGVSELVGEPVPEGGLGYGESASFEKLPHIDSKQDGVVPYVITGDLSLIAGLDCAGALARAAGVRTFPALGPAVLASGAAGEGGQNGQSGQSGQSGQGGESTLPGASGQGGDGPAGGKGGTGASGASGANGEGAQAGASPETPPETPALRFGALPGLPAGTLAEGYSVLEVADGCFGAPAFTHDRELDICGADYTPSTGSLTAELVILGRATAPDALAMQALHASRGSGSLGVRAAPPTTAVESWITIVDGFTEGALEPTDPKRNVSSQAYGTTQRLWTVDATVNQATVFSDRWSVIKKRAGIAELEDGRGYTLVVLGPSYEVDGKGFWNPATFGLVDNDPGGE